MEKDADGLIRTCNVRYRLLRYDLPAEDMKFYFKGLRFKTIDVPVQRLSLILPVEEQNLLPSELLKYAVIAEGLSCDGQVLEDSMDLDQKTGKLSCENDVGLVQAYGFKVFGRKKGRHRSSKSVLDLHQSYCLFEQLWKECEKWDHVAAS